MPSPSFLFPILLATALVVSSIGLSCIILIMLRSTKRLEASQNRRYGELPEFQQYIKSVPILFP